jgi:hypothetical protein
MKLEEHIATFENVLTPQECQSIIAHYDKLSSLQLSFSRLDLKEAPHRKSDNAVYVLCNDTITVTPDMSVLHPFLNKFWICYDQFLKHYSVLGETGKHRIRSMKIQKTLPGEGYHVWHFEGDSPMATDRICSWGVYLNTVDQGGETEFLYQSLRIPAVEGNLVIWPAGYTHVHRGNPPLSGGKYLLTGWVEWN